MILRMNPLEFLYYIGYTLHRRQGLARRRRLGGRVVSVGNLTLGGTGKTPLVMAIAAEAVKRGFRACVLTRGYRGDAGGTLVVSRGHGPLTTCSEAGDEAVLMAERLRDVWIIKGADRYRSGLAAAGMDLFILDDGFQHWRLHRDVEILTIDGADPWGGGRLLPLGRLREPLRAMKRADIIVIKSAGQGDGGVEEVIRRHNSRAPILRGEYRAAGLVNPGGEEMPLHVLRDRRVLAFSGIGNPGGFVETLVRAGASIAGLIPFRDHHRYTEADLERIAAKAAETAAELIVTTEKDMVKLRELPSLDGVHALRVSLEINGRELYDRVFDGLRPSATGEGAGAPLR